MQLNSQSLSRDRFDVKTTSRIAPSAAIEAKHYDFYCTVFGITAIIANLVNSLSGAVCC